MKLLTITLVVLTSGAAILAHAQSSGFSVDDRLTPVFSPANDLSKVTSFSIQDFEISPSSANSGVFTSLSIPQDFGAISFTPSVASSLSFGNAVFGHFTSTNIFTIFKNANFANYNVSGFYTSGTFDGGAIVNIPASVVLSFSNQGGSQLTGAFSVQVDPVPEPGTMVLAALGGASLLLLRRRK